MRILKEDTVIVKETLPVSFLTDMISKGWDEVGYLKDASSAIKETYKDTAKINKMITEKRVFKEERDQELKELYERLGIE